jgi:hypothetical protein
MHALQDGNPQSEAERLTRFGKALRSTSLDELPALFNVIKVKLLSHLADATSDTLAPRQQPERTVGQLLVRCSLLHNTKCPFATC